MSFTHLNHLSRWTGLRNSDQFNSFLRHSMLSAAAPTLLISSSSICPMTASPDLNLLVLDDLTMDQPECSPDTQPHHSGSVQSTIHSRGSMNPPDGQDMSHGAVHSSESDPKADAKSNESNCNPSVRSVAFNQTQLESSEASGTTTDVKFKIVIKGLLESPELCALWCLLLILLLHTKHE